MLPAGLCPDWDQWDQSKPVDNAREAMQQADDWLGIPQVTTVTNPAHQHASVHVHEVLKDQCQQLAPPPPPPVPADLTYETE